MSSVGPEQESVDSKPDSDVGANTLMSCRPLDDEQGRRLPSKGRCDN